MIIGIIISLVFLYFSLRNIQFDQFVDALSKTSIRIFVLSLVPTFLAFWFRAIRWKILLQPMGRYTGSELFGPMMVGFMGNNIFPARIGEILRAYAVSKKLKISLPSSLATIILERLFDGIVLIGMLLVVVFMYPFPARIKHIGYLIALIYGVLLLVLFFIQKSPQRTENVIMKILFFLPHPIRDRIRKMLDSFITGFSILRDFKRTIIILGHSLGVWISSALILYVILLACRMTDLPITASLVILAITAIGSMIPAAPGYIGTSQYFTIIAFSVFRIGESQALAYSIVYFVSQYVPVTLVGIFYFYYDRISLADIELNKVT